jgi:hypothetical protein
MNSNAKLKKLARTLLATTCLTAGAAVASASTFNEVTDFTAFPTVTLLGSGIDVVNGSLGAPDFDDYFQISGLTPGDLYKVTFASVASDFMYLRNSSGGQISFLAPSQSVTTAGLPDGIFNFEAQFEGGSGAYTVTLSDVTAPEPGTLALTGLAAAALLSRRRNK